MLTPSYSVEDAVEMGLNSEDYALLSMVDGRRTLYELCADGPKQGKDNAKFLYAMFILGRIRRAGGGREDEPGEAPVQMRAFKRSEGTTT